MRKLFLSIVLTIACSMLWANPVTVKTAEQVAKNWYAHNASSKVSNYEVSKTIAEKYNGLTTFYTFIFKSGGFVIVSADDAARPILGYSTEGVFDGEFNPTAKSWLEGYNKQIENVIVNKVDNKATSLEWSNISKNIFKESKKAVPNLLTTTWDQDTYYNYYCPTAAGGPGGKAYAGCVATAMGQVMKYHNFPATGIGSHSYVSKFGLLSANFGAATYNWASMPAFVTSTTYQEVAKLLYHLGVSVDMNYAADGSGAYSEDVPYSLYTYFNYHPSVVLKSKADYTDANWIALLKTELDASRPIYYAGSGTSGGHAFVCSGYDATDKFYFNWGWSGSANGYFTIGSLNTSNGSFNDNNRVVINIKPGNPNFICRITEPSNNQYINPGQTVVVKAITSVAGGKVVDRVEFFIDDIKKTSVTAEPYNYTWVTEGTPLGIHSVKVLAISTTNDSSFHSLNVNLNAWTPQATGFTTASRGIRGVKIVNENVAWAWAYDGSGGSAKVKDFTRTKDGGKTWTPKTVPNSITNPTASLTNFEFANIYPVDSATAWAAMFGPSGGGKIVKISNFTGTANPTYTHQATATFSAPNGFPNVVHMFDLNNGWCMGDPNGGYFEIYTTTNGGTNWTRVSQPNIDGGATPASGEYGTTNLYDTYGDTSWFGTNKGRVFKSVDKGLTWTAAQAYTGALGASPSCDVKFKNGREGIAIINDNIGDNTVHLMKTTDGGATWTAITPTGINLNSSDLSYIPQADAWMNVSASQTLGGSVISFDNCASFQNIDTSTTIQYTCVKFLNNKVGYAGGFSQNATTGGMFKWVGHIPGVDFAANATQVSATEAVTFTNLSDIDGATGYIWSFEGGSPATSTDQNPTGVTFADAGAHDVTLTVVTPSKNITWTKKDYISVSTGKVIISEDKSVRMFPNPAVNVLNVQATSAVKSVKVVDLIGKEVLTLTPNTNNITINTAELLNGFYMITVETAVGSTTQRVMINK